MISIKEYKDAKTTGFVESEDKNVFAAITSHVPGELFENIIQILKQSIFTAEFSNKFPGYFVPNLNLTESRMSVGCVYYRDKGPNTKQEALTLIVGSLHMGIPLETKNSLQKTIELGGLKYERAPQGLKQRRAFPLTRLGTIGSRDCRPRNTVICFKRRFEAREKNHKQSMI